MIVWANITHPHADKPLVDHNSHDQNSAEHECCDQLSCQTVDLSSHYLINAFANSFDDMHDQAYQGRLGNYARALIEPQMPVQVGDRIRLRLINVAPDRVFPVAIIVVDGKVVSKDGMPLRTPEDVMTVILAPAQRVDLISDVTTLELINIDFPTDVRSIPTGGNSCGRRKHTAQSFEDFCPAIK